MSPLEDVSILISLPERDMRGALGTQEFGHVPDSRAEMKSLGPGRGGRISISAVPSSFAETDSPDSTMTTSAITPNRRAFIAHLLKMTWSAALRRHRPAVPAGRTPPGSGSADPPALGLSGRTRSLQSRHGTPPPPPTSGGGPSRAGARTGPEDPPRSRWQRPAPRDRCGAGHRCRTTRKRQTRERRVDPVVIRHEVPWRLLAPTAKTCWT
jgi:hypothetical protein